RPCDGRRVGPRMDASWGRRHDDNFLSCLARMTDVSLLSGPLRSFGLCVFRGTARRMSAYRFTAITKKDRWGRAENGLSDRLAFMERASCDVSTARVPAAGRGSIGSPGFGQRLRRDE